jgi:hypothetical protein
VPALYEWSCDKPFACVAFVLVAPHFKQGAGSHVARQGYISESNELMAWLAWAESSYDAGPGDQGAVRLEAYSLKTCRQAQGCKYSAVATPSP